MRPFSRDLLRIQFRTFLCGRLGRDHPGWDVSGASFGSGVKADWNSVASVRIGLDHPLNPERDVVQSTG